MGKEGFICGSNYHVMANYIPTVLYLGVVGCMLLSLVAVCGSYFELLSQAALLGLGLATRVVMGFTPTIYVSEKRTFLFLYIALGVSAAYFLGAGLYLWWKALREKPAVWETLKVAGAIAAVLGIVLDLAEIGTW